MVEHVHGEICGGKPGQQEVAPTLCLPHCNANPIVPQWVRRDMAKFCVLYTLTPNQDISTKVTICTGDDVCAFSHHEGSTAFDDQER
jgi:hypothetical protein